MLADLDLEDFLALVEGQEVSGEGRVEGLGDLVVGRGDLEVGPGDLVVGLGDLVVGLGDLVEGLAYLENKF